MESANIELFTAYIEKSLSSAELESFENRLKEDSSFVDAFDEFKDIYQIVENSFSPERAAVMESIQKADSKFNYETSSESHSKKTIAFKPWQMGIAASILLVIGFYLFNNMGQPSYSDYANPGEIVLTVRSESNLISKEAETSFNSAKYNEAIIYFDELLETSPENAEIRFYKAISLIETDKFADGETLLQSLSEGSSAYAYKAVFWRALSQLKQKKYKKAKSILEQIPSTSPEYKNAKELLSEL